MKKIVLMLVLIATGTVIVALPDDGKRLFSISRDHGPSIQDAIGLILVFMGYGWLLRQVWIRRQKIFKHRNKPLFKLMPPLFGIGIVIIIASVLKDYGYWWVCGALILIILQSIIFYITLSD